MTLLFQTLLKPALFCLDAERAHDLSIAALETGLSGLMPGIGAPALPITVAGIDFPNPVGLAAGYDKNCRVPDALLGLGFGFVEAGTVTPKPQPGNPKPRLFRLTGEQAIINRFGFNNDGHAAFLRRLKERSGRPGLIGVNVGANKDSANRIADYALGVKTFAPHAAYITINISSPNTPGLRALQSRAQLSELLTHVIAARPKRAGRVPIFLKIAPDLPDDELADIAAEILDKGIDGAIVSNTTLSRRGIAAPEAGEAGGLSGAPLFRRSTIMLARLRRLVGPDVALIGVGGIDSAETAIEKVRAGADLVQVYSGVVYRGPGLAGTIVRGLRDHLRRNGLPDLRALRDEGVEEWAAQDPESPGR